METMCEYGPVELKTLEVTFDIVTSRKIHSFEGESRVTIGISVSSQTISQSIELASLC